MCILESRLPASVPEAADFFDPASPRATRGPGTSSQEGGLMTQTILLLDDNTQLRNVVRRLLEGAGYLVVAAGTAVEAFEFAAAPGARIDLLLTDVVLPGLAGPEVARVLRGMRPRLPVLYMSGHSQIDLTAPGPHDPDVAFLQKPFSSEALIHKVRGLLDREKPHRGTANPAAG
jgi:two-component system, cell cycle sensor histidine kinase and response regulator CckA